MVPEQAAEYVNETTFITDHRALDRARYTVRPSKEVDAIFLPTDGLRFKILADLGTSTPFVPFFEDVEAYLQSREPRTDALRQFLSGLDDQSGDDKTLVAAVRMNSPRGLDTGTEGPATEPDERQRQLSAEEGLA